MQSCPGIAGYRLLVLDDDSRQSVTVVDPTRKKHELNLWDVITGAFSSVGEKAEWRVVKKGRRAVPFALIIRVVANENVENPTDKRSYLSVTKISSDSICVTHKINPGPNANEAARKAADEAAITPCLKEITP